MVRSYNFSERCTGVALSENIMHLLEICNFRKKIAYNWCKQAIFNMVDFYYIHNRNDIN